MRISNGKEDSFVNMISPITIASAMAAGAASSSVRAVIKVKNPALAGAVSAGAGASAGLLTGAFVTEGVRRLRQYYTSKGDQPGVVGERYVKMWRTRRRKYGPTGRSM